VGSPLLRDEERQAPPEDGSLRRNDIELPANVAALVAAVFQVPSQGLHRGQIWQYADQGYVDAAKMLSQQLRNRRGTERIPPQSWTQLTFSRGAGIGDLRSAAPSEWREDLPAAEGKTLTDLVVSACGAEEAFVQKKFFGNESGEMRLNGHLGLESSKGLPAVFATSKCYVRLEGATLRDESASLR
jgi:hypothetical protein